MLYEESGRELSLEECWNLLDDEPLGRLAYRLVDELSIVPVNHAVDRGTLLFRTAEGSKLLAVLLDEDVAYEVDRVLGEEARSVVVRGKARKLEEDEAYRADRVGLHPWIAEPKYDVVQIEPVQVTGRAFRIEPTYLSRAGAAGPGR